MPLISNNKIGITDEIILRENSVTKLLEWRGQLIRDIGILKRKLASRRSQFHATGQGEREDYDRTVTALSIQGSLMAMVENQIALIRSKEV